MGVQTYTCGTNSRDPVQAEGYLEARTSMCQNCPNPICRGPVSPQQRRDKRKAHREHIESLKR